MTKPSGLDWSVLSLHLPPHLHFHSPPSFRHGRGNCISHPSLLDTTEIPSFPCTRHLKSGIHLMYLDSDKTQRSFGRFFRPIERGISAAHCSSTSGFHRFLTANETLRLYDYQLHEKAGLVLKQISLPKGLLRLQPTVLFDQTDPIPLLVDLS